MQKTLYVGLDVHKASISVTVAEDGREGKVNFVGTIPNSPIALTKLAKKLAKGGHRLEFCCEAGCCGYGIYRHLTALGHGCTVVAASMIPRKRGAYQNRSS
jgi:transposase